MAPMSCVLDMAELGVLGKAETESWCGARWEKRRGVLERT